MAGTIILLEDAEINRKIVSKFLQNLGFQVLEGANGEDGFELLEQCEADGIQVVAIVSDMLMPLVDGPTFVRDLRENVKYESLPIIFMTTATDKSFLLQAKNLKAGYILKPVDGSQLETQLRALTK